MRMGWLIQCLLSLPRANTASLDLIRTAAPCTVKGFPAFWLRLNAERPQDRPGLKALGLVLLSRFTNLSPLQRDCGSRGGVHGFGDRIWLAENTDAFQHTGLKRGFCGGVDRRSGIEAARSLAALCGFGGSVCVGWWELVAPLAKRLSLPRRGHILPKPLPYPLGAALVLSAVRVRKVCSRKKTW